MATTVALTGTWRYRTNCVEERGRAVQNMQEEARSISRATFLKYVDRESLQALEEILGYESHHSRGLTMSQDGYVDYYRSIFRGRDCVYVANSGIEYIFY